VINVFIVRVSERGVPKYNLGTRGNEGRVVPKYNLGTRGQTRGTAASA
jgi:hypothetical protein